MIQTLVFIIKKNNLVPTYINKVFGKLKFKLNYINVIFFFRLNLFIAADEWRLQYLKETVMSTGGVSSWSDFRRNFSLLETSDADILGHSYVVHNKPFIG